MRLHQDYDTDLDQARQLVRDNPFGTLVSGTSAGLRASHYPVLVDESRAELSLFTHLGRPDEEVLEIGRQELLIIVQGPHGYLSPGRYGSTPAVPTWKARLSQDRPPAVVDAVIAQLEGSGPDANPPLAAQMRAARGG